MQVVVTLITSEGKSSKVVEVGSTADAIEQTREKYVLGADTVISAIPVARFKELFGKVPTQ